MPVFCSRSPRGTSCARHDGTSDDQSCRPLKEARALDIEYGYALLHVNDSDLRPICTIGTSLFTRVMTVLRRWHGGKTEVDSRPDNPSPVARTTHESTQPLPFDIVEMIIVHLARDLDTLKACSLTCRSWYTVVAPRLHHTLILRGKGRSSTHDQPDQLSNRGQPNPPSTRDKLKPLSVLHHLGLMHHVKEIRVEQWRDMISWFIPLAFGPRTLDHLSAFTNVRTLKIQELDIDRFIPGIERYFGQFSSTLRSITLYNPHCTPQQLSHFLSLFSDLDDVGVREARACISNPIATDAELIPFSTPKLRGLLALYDFNWVETWTHLVSSCGGLRFRYMDVRRGASCVPFLFEACAETLETLRFNIPFASGK